jgi:hypothetical protein
MKLSNWDLSIIYAGDYEVEINYAGDENSVDNEMKFTLDGQTLPLAKENNKSITLSPS